MRIVVADTSPIRYLVVIGEIEILPALFGPVIIPTVVRDELTHPRAPEAVRTWMPSPAALAGAACCACHRIRRCIAKPR